MDCLRCQNEAEPGKALCSACLAEKPVIPADTQKIQTSILRAKELQELVSELSYAGFWLRAIAAIVDALVLGFMQKLVWGAIFTIFGPFAVLNFLSGSSDGLNPSSVISASLKGMIWFYLAPVLLYYGIFESSRWQGTPGKALLGIRVTDLDGMRLGIFKAFIRALSRFSNLVSLVPALITVLSSPFITFSSLLLSLGISIVFIPYSYAMAGFTNQKQAFHDKVASTLVVKGPKFSKERVGIAVVLVLWLFVFSFVSIYKDEARWGALTKVANGIWQMLF